MSRRANSANPADAFAVLTRATVEQIAAAYDQHGQASIVRLPSLMGPGADLLLESLGYEAEGISLTLIAPAEVVAFPESDLSPAPTPEWRAALNRINGRGAPQAAVFDAAVARLEAPAAFAAVRREGRIVSGAYAAFSDGWLCLEAVATDPDWRGRGLARQAVSALMGWGARQGARACALQVSEDNDAGLRLYRGLGFRRELYRYHYRRGRSAS